MLCQGGTWSLIAFDFSNLSFRTENICSPTKNVCSIWDGILAGLVPAVWWARGAAPWQTLPDTNRVPGCWRAAFLVEAGAASLQQVSHGSLFCVLRQTSPLILEPEISVGREFFLFSLLVQNSLPCANCQALSVWMPHQPRELSTNSNITVA